MLVSKGAAVIEFILLLMLIFPVVINKFSEKKYRPVTKEWCYFLPVGFALLTGFVFFTNEPVELIFTPFKEVFSWKLSLGFRFDSLSALVSTAVTLIGASVMRYSVRYLADDPNKLKFNHNLSTTLCFVLFMLNSSSLLGFWLAWVGTSFFLHKLLLHFHDRPGARKAARQKFWVSRVGDLFIVMASLVLFKLFGTLDFNQLVSDQMESAQMVPASQSSDFYQQNYFLLTVAGVFLVLGAMAKSAQFPFHYWLPQTMETPTPVSALMHAGIINAGGFLVVRMGGFLNHAPIALNLLAIVGGFTAIFGTVVMLTQTSVKKSLAYSTISQMGFMMLQCGLGAFSIAVVHIIGHAFYKAYAFLGSGTATDYGKLRRYLGAKPAVDHNLWLTFVVGVVGLSFTLFTGPYLGYPLTKPGALVLLSVLGLALAQIFISFKYKGAALKSMGLLFISYFVLYHLVENILMGSLQTKVTYQGVYETYLSVFLAALFMLLFIFQNNLFYISKTKLGRKLYVRSLNGGLRG